ncbi:hypothetical protein [Vagococcus intermedius]|uniref:Uncharacterized protein n=1 Tax=Vagococcus intermedius TaxID=2991418 RepID=A0AAF0I8J4_9ENTE|nr:hypothetical protein [Vagococcus intermedius]WEG74445.1 hypothetical protein OL234_10875 [Vagococcus intermedius]WEG76468.1 hypothetical protein OL235_10525 [Vagococcus intermedius]
MKIIQRSIEIKWPILLFEVIFLIGGIMLIATGIKIRKQSKSSAVFSIILGIIITLVSLYLLFWTFIVGYNS